MIDKWLYDNAVESGEVNDFDFVIPLHLIEELLKTHSIVQNVIEEEVADTGARPGMSYDPEDRRFGAG